MRSMAVTPELQFTAVLWGINPFIADPVKALQFGIYAIV